MDLSTLESKDLVAPATTILVFFLGLILSVTTAAWGYRFWKLKRLLFELEQGSSLEKRKAELKQGRTLDEWYHYTLNSGLEAADRFFGRSLISFRAWGVCLTLAVLYPIALFFGTWTLTGNAQLGGLTVFEEQVAWYRRGLLLPILIGYGFLMFRLFSYSAPRDRVSVRVAVVAVVAAGAGAGGGAIAFAGAGAVGVAGSVAGAVAVAGAGAVAVSGAVGVGVAGSVAGALAVALAVAVVVAVVVAGADTVLSDFNISLPLILVLLFLAFLPIVNSLMDFLSWAITRRLGRRLQRHFSRGLALALGTADLGVAIILLATLAFALGMGFTVMNGWLPFEEPLDFQVIVQSAVQHPFGEGLWITLMLASTLIPTGIHLFLVVLGFVGKLRDSRRQQSWIEEIDGAIERNKEIGAAIERGEEVSEVRMRHAQLDPATCREIAHELVLTRLLAFGLGSAALLTVMCAVLFLVPAVYWQEIIDGLVWCAELGRKGALYIPGVS